MTRPTTRNTGPGCPLCGSSQPGYVCKIDPNARLWEAAEALLLILLAVIVVCGLAGFAFAHFGDAIERAVWAVANMAWALAGRLS